MKIEAANNVSFGTRKIDENIRSKMTNLTLFWENCFSLFHNYVIVLFKIEETLLGFNNLRASNNYSKRKHLKIKSFYCSLTFILCNKHTSHIIILLYYFLFKFKGWKMLVEKLLLNPVQKITWQRLLEKKIGKNDFIWKSRKSG